MASHRRLRAWAGTIDRALHGLLHRFGHDAHRISLGVLFIWFGLLKPFGVETTTSIIAHTIWFGPPDLMVPLLGWWEVAIGVSLMIRSLLRLAVLLLAIRLPGIVLALLIFPTRCFEQFPFAPTPEGQYLLKDLAIFLAALAIAATIRPLPEQSGPKPPPIASIRA